MRGIIDIYRSSSSGRSKVTCWLGRKEDPKESEEGVEVEVKQKQRKAVSGSRIEWVRTQRTRGEEAQLMVLNSKEQVTHYIESS